MEIFYYGHSSFRLKGKGASVVIDPYTEKVGKLPRDVEANLVLVTHDHTDHNAAEKIGGSPFVISGPGEYEVGGTSVIGMAAFHDNKQGEERGVNTIYIVEMDNLRVVHLGDLGHKLSQEQLDQMGPVDVALVPVGGFFTIDAKMAAEVVKQLDPWAVIPMHYKQEGLADDLLEKLAPVDDFLKEMGKSDVVPLPKYTITADKLPAEMQVVVLERK